MGCAFTTGLIHGGRLRSCCILENARIYGSHAPTNGSSATSATA